MKTFDRIVLATIAAALVLIALHPYMANARQDRIDVNVVAVGGKSIGYGGPISITSK
jgi:hypothetical protein